MFVKKYDGEGNVTHSGYVGLGNKTTDKLALPAVQESLDRAQITASANLRRTLRIAFRGRAY